MRSVVRGIAIMLAFVAVLASSPAWAQTALGVATPPGITFQAPPPPVPGPSQAVRVRLKADSTWSPALAGPGLGSDSHATSGDLFLAGPYTYAPRHRRSHARLRTVLVPYVVPSFPYFPLGDFSLRGMGGAVEPIVTGERYVDILPTDTPAFPSRPDLVESPASEAPRPSVRPPLPKTLYVIPRCYAGDRLPDASQLPAGCRVDDVQVIPAAR